MSTDARVAARGPLDALLVTTLVSAGLLLVNLLSLVLMQLGVGAIDLWKPLGWGWALLGLAQAAVDWWLARTFRGRPAAAPMWWAAMFASLEAGLQLVNSFGDALSLPGLAAAMEPVSIRLAWLAVGWLVQGLTFIALWRWSLGRHPGLAVAFWGAFAAGVLFGLTRTLLPKEQLLVVIRDWRWPWMILTYGLSFTRIAVMAWVIRVARQTGEGAALSAPEAAAPAADPMRDVVVGAVLLVVGLGVTVVSISLVSSGAGGRYVVATGAIAVGLVRLVRGLMALSASSARSPLDPPEGR